MYRMGARYMTLTHGCNTPWADAAQVESHKVSVKRALFLKIRVESGWGDFSSVHAVSVF